MRLISWNVNGLRSIYKKGFFMPFMETYSPDVLCLQETRAEQHQSEVDLPHYEEYWNSATRKGYSGTAIFSKIKPISIRLNLPEKFIRKYDLASDAYGDPNTEGRVIAAEFEQYFVVNVYTPNAKEDLSRLSFRHAKWDPAFLSYCRELEKEKPVIFCGDLNVAHTPDDLSHPESNMRSHGFTKEECEGIDQILQAGFIDSFRYFTKGKGYYTWWSHWSRARERNIGWRIDYVFVSQLLEKRLIRADILPTVLGSDHCPVLLEIK